MGYDHLDDGRIQAFLDGELSPRETARAREHAGTCVRCRSEIEAWRLLFDELGELSQLDPGIDLAERVLAELPPRTPAPIALPGWLEGALGERDRHLAPERLQDFLEGSMSAAGRGRLEGHLERCEPCRNELAGWAAMFSRLEDLTRLDPSEDFARNVMERVTMRAPAPAEGPGLAARLRRRAAAWSWADISGLVPSWARNLAPRSRRAWAVVASVAAAPTVALAALAVMLFSHPLLTPATLASYLWWRATALVSVFGARATELITQVSDALRDVTVLGTVVGSATNLALVAVVLTAMMGTSLWILYRNLFAPGTSSRHARTTS